jgi:FSR family fosmidomycin resistance protein-like MFS transporter
MLVALLSVRMADESAGFLIPGSFESFRSELDLSYAQAATILAAGAPGAIVANGFSIAADYVSRRVIAAGGAFGFAAALAVFATTDSYLLLVAASFAIGVAASAMVDASELALVDLSGDDLPRMLGAQNFMGSIGDLAGPLVIIVAAALGFGWEAPFLFGAVLMAAFGAWLAMSPLPPPHRADDHPTPRRAIAEIVRDRRVWVYGAMAALLGPLDEPFLAFLIARLQRTDGLSAAGATAIAMVTIVGALIGSAQQARHAPPTPPLMRPAITVAVAVTLVAVAPSALLVLPGALVFGFGIIGFWTALQARVLKLRPGQAGTVSAVVSTIEFSGFLIPIGIGVVVDMYGLRAGLACYAVLAGLLLALVAFDRSREGTLQPVAS